MVLFMWNTSDHYAKPIPIFLAYAALLYAANELRFEDECSKRPLSKASYNATGTGAVSTVQLCYRLPSPISPGAG